MHVIPLRIFRRFVYDGRLVVLQMLRMITGWRRLPVRRSPVDDIGLGLVLMVTWLWEFVAIVPDFLFPDPFIRRPVDNASVAIVGSIYPGPLFRGPVNYAGAIVYVLRMRLETPQLVT